MSELLAVSIEQLHPHLSFEVLTQFPSTLEAQDALILCLNPSANEALMHQAEALLGKHEGKVFKCVKFPVDPQAMPEGMRNLLAYNFYELDTVAGTIESPDVLTAAMPMLFWTQLVDLAYDILGATAAKGSTMNIGKGKAIYLAETGFDLDQHRRTIRRELSRFGYRVLPQNLLPQAEEHLRPIVHQELEQCIFSIHLVSEGRGELLAGQDVSIAEFQYELAEFHAHQQAKRGENFQILVWMPPFLKFTNERQQLFAEKLIEKADAQKGIELIQMQLEDFKTVVLRQLAIQLKKKIGQSNHDTSINTDRRSAYLIADLRDVENSKPLAEWLPKKGFDVFWMGNDNRAAERGRHIAYLNQSDANIVFFERATKEWLITKLQDILKAPGLGRRKPKCPTIVWAANSQAQRFAQDLIGRMPQYSDVKVLSALETLEPLLPN